MSIAIIAWGSLVWDPRSLPCKGEWEPGGPELSIEFSRVSKDCRLTLVVDGENGVLVGTRFVTSKRRNLRDAIADLRDREGTIWSRIGYVDITHGTNSAQAFPQPEPTFSLIEAWVKEKGFDAAVWTALPSSFKKETGDIFSVDVAASYIRRLPNTARRIAVEYFEKAPPEVSTPLRRHLAEEGIIASEEKWGVR